MATLPREDGTISVQLSSDYSYRSGVFMSGQYRIVRANGTLANWSDSDTVGVIVSSNSECVSGATVKVVTRGQTYVRTGETISGSQYVRASGAGLAYIAAPYATTSRDFQIIGKIIGTSSDVYAAGTYAPVDVNVYTTHSGA